MRTYDLVDLRSYNVCGATEKMHMHTHECDLLSDHSELHKCRTCGLTFGMVCD